MTTRELRQMLFEVTNQDMTVAELRRVLFEVDEQDEELTETKLKQITKREEKTS